MYRSGVSKRGEPHSWGRGSIHRVGEYAENIKCWRMAYIFGQYRQYQEGLIQVADSVRRHAEGSFAAATAAGEHHQVFHQWL